MSRKLLYKALVSENLRLKKENEDLHKSVDALRIKIQEADAKLIKMQRQSIDKHQDPPKSDNDCVSEIRFSYKQFIFDQDRDYETESRHVVDELGDLYFEC